jgi:hypothetical protein
MKTNGKRLPKSIDFSLKFEIYVKVKIGFYPVAAAQHNTKIHVPDK